MHQEIWAHKTCDNMSVLKTGLAMIEGIYGRDGNGFGIGNDYLTNLVMFSKDKFRLDLIGLYLGGHEPGNITSTASRKSAVFPIPSIPGKFRSTNGSTARRFRAS